MAISAATMTVTLTESVTLNGSVRGSTNTLTLSDIHEVVERTVTILHTSEVEIIAFSTAVTSGTFIEGDARYIRITNLDDTNSVELAVVTVGTTYQVKIGAGESHILAGGANDMMLAEADTTPSFGVMADIKSLRVNPGGNLVDIEVFIASV